MAKSSGMRSIGDQPRYSGKGMSRTANTGVQYRTTGIRSAASSRSGRKASR